MNSLAPSPYFVTVARIGEALPVCNADHPAKIADYWKANIATLPGYDVEKEHLYVFVLDTKLNIKAVNLVSIGSLNETVSHPREIFRPAIAAAGSRVILAHNHPSGDSTPSESDRKMAYRVRDAGEILMIPLQDFLVIGTAAEYREGFYSMRLAGLL